MKSRILIPVNLSPVSYNCNLILSLPSIDRSGYRDSTVDALVEFRKQLAQTEWGRTSDDTDIPLLAHVRAPLICGGLDDTHRQRVADDSFRPVLAAQEVGRARADRAVRRRTSALGPQSRIDDGWRLR